MPCSSRAVRKLLFLLLVSVLLAPSQHSVYAVGESSQEPAGGALYIKTPAVSDYGYVARDISVSVKNGSDYSVELWVKIMRFSTFPAGILFVFDLIDQAGSVRFSIRLTTDRSVMFYYPFGESSAVFTVKEAWHPTWWYGYSIRLQGSLASFYVNGTSVGTSESTGLEALGGGFNLVAVSRLGEADANDMIFEGFIDSVAIFENGLPLFFEGFEEGLGSYEIFKSQDAIVNLLSASAFTTLTLIVDPRSFSSGGSTTLLGWLKDTANLGVANRTVYFEYDLGDGTWVLLGSTLTGSDGTFKYLWKTPSELKGSIKVRARFQGDEAYANSISEPVQLSIKPQPRFTLDYRYVVLLLLIGLLAGILVLKRKVGVATLLSSCFLLVGAFFTFFSILIVANSLQLAYYLAYQRRVIDIAIFSSGEDFSLWLGSLACLVILPQLFGYISGIRSSRSFAVVYLILLVAGVFRFLGFDGASIGLAVLAGLTMLSIGIWRSKDVLSISRSRALSIYFFGLLVILLPIELGSSLAWVYNSFDPHYPFDGDPRWILPSVETQFFNIAHGATPLLLLMLLFAWILIPVLRTVLLRFSRGLGSAVSWHRRESGEEDRFSGAPRRLELLSRFGPKLLLLLSFLLSVYLVYYPYFYQERLLGVDTARFYYPKLREMNDWESVRAILIGEPRAPYLLLLFCLKVATGLDPLLIVKIGPALPAILFALSSYVFLHVMTKDEWLAGVGSLLSVFSIQTTVGMFAGIFTNWLAMSEVMLFFTFFLKGSEAGFRGRWAPGIILMGFILLFTHGWTWGVVMAVVVVYLLSALFGWRLNVGRRLELKRESAFAILVLAFCVAPIFLVILALPFVPSSVGAIAAVSSGYTEVLGSMSLSFLANIWAVVVFTITYYVGGFFGSPIIYLLGFLGAFRVLKVGGNPSRVLFSWLALISAGSVLVDSWYQWRLLYLLPFQVFVGLGLQTLADVGRSLSLEFRRTDRDRGSYGIFEFLLVLVVLLSLFDYTLRSLNYLIPS